MIINSALTRMGGTHACSKCCSQESMQHAARSPIFFYAASSMPHSALSNPVPVCYAARRHAAYRRHYLYIGITKSKSLDTRRNHEETND
jgi:hypothetical protein